MGKKSKMPALVRILLGILLVAAFIKLLLGREHFDGILGSFFTGTMWFIGIVIVLAVLYSLFKPSSGSSAPTYVSPV